MVKRRKPFLISPWLYPYLYDILILGESPGEVEQSVQTTLQVLTWAGFIVNLKKFNLTHT